MTGLNNWFQGVNLDRIIEWLMFGAAALIAISVHESSHALSAHWLGDDTAKRMGRISLNPLRHLDLMGFLMMVVAHFGWAKPVPVDMRRFKNPKQGMAVTAAAGPISNVLLAIVFGFLTWILWAVYLRQGMAAGSMDRNLLYYVVQFCEVSEILNAGLAVFNLIPVSPLDGSKILGLILPEKTYFQLMRYERYGMPVLIVLLALGVLDGPLEFLRGGLLDGIDLLAKPVVMKLAGL